MITKRVRPGQLMRSYGIGYVQAQRMIRHYTLLHWRRYGWLGAIALAALLMRLVAGFAGLSLSGAARALLLAIASVGAGVQLWLAQRAAYPQIMQEAESLRAQQREGSQ